MNREEFADSEKLTQLFVTLSDEQKKTLVYILNKYKGNYELFVRDEDLIQKTGLQCKFSNKLKAFLKVFLPFWVGCLLGSFPVILH